MGAETLTQPVPKDEMRPYQARDTLFHSIGWKLARGNARFCKDAVPAIGLQLIDMAGFSSTKTANMMRAELGLAGDFAVQTLATGSPAQASMLKTNTEITAIDGAPINDWPLVKSTSDWQRLKLAHDTVEASLRDDGMVVLTLASGQTINLIGEMVCSSRFELVGGGKKALADGSRVQFGARMAAFDFAEDELAAAIAHELAHNLLGHRKWLDKNGRTRKGIRATEREADRLMPWLLANAGYDPEAALRFMNRWGPKHSKGILRARTHDGWDERAEFIAAELVEVKTHFAKGGSADWPTHFRREIEPETAAR